MPERACKAATGEREAPRSSEQWAEAVDFAALVEHAPAMLWRANPDGMCDFFNAGWLAYRGRSLEQEIGLGWAQGVHPEDYDHCLAVFTRAFAEKRPYSVEYRLQRGDGSYGWVLGRGQPFERGGVYAGYLGACTDIDERRRDEEMRRRCVSEINHRSKNLIAVVQAIAWQTFSHEGDPAAASKSFFARLQAMGRAHDLLSAEDWLGVDLAEMLRQIAEPHGGDDPAIFTIAGDPVWLPPKQAMAIGLCLNELLTNASKHGALSRPEGRVDVTWERDTGGLGLLWKESGVPPPAEARAPGLGLRLVEALARDAGGTARWEKEIESGRCAWRLHLPARVLDARPGAGGG